MQYRSHKLECKGVFPKTCRIAPFTYVTYEFDYTLNEDKGIIDLLLIEANRLAEQVFPGAANDSLMERSKNRILANCIAGVFSEFCWKHFLNFKSEAVRSTPFTSASNQIDLEVIQNGKKIEVRSSFPRNGLEFAICHPTKEFDILGPYSNSYKPGEVTKDFFVRTLFVMQNPTDIIQAVKSNHFTLYLTGGATHDMMFDDKYSKEKDFIPEDNFTTQQASVYRVVPFHNALDCAQIYHLIRQEI